MVPGIPLLQITDLLFCCQLQETLCFKGLQWLGLAHLDNLPILRPTVLFNITNDDSKIHPLHSSKDFVQCVYTRRVKSLESWLMEKNNVFQARRTCFSPLFKVTPQFGVRPVRGP